MAERTKGWKHWSTNERVAAVILLSVLAVFLTLLGLILYEPPTGPGLCGAFGATPCPGRENLNIVSATVNSPTNMTVQIWNIGSVAISLISYNVKSTYSQPYQSNNWSGPTGPKYLRNDKFTHRRECLHISVCHLLLDSLHHLAKFPVQLDSQSILVHKLSATQRLIREKQEA